MQKKITKHAKDLISKPNKDWNVSDITLAKEILIRFRTREKIYRYPNEKKLKKALLRLMD